MKSIARRATALSLTAACCGLANAQEVETSDRLEVFRVYGEQEETRSATKLDLTIFETPQVVSVVSRDQIEDFSLREVNSLLKYVPGVTVEQVETDRTYYTARGFDIVNFQYDGVGVPFSYGLTQGHDDTAIYEQVEVIKGATGLVTGLANPSATINYVRKRPTDVLESYVTASAGSWDTFRLEGDISGPITDRVGGRLVVAREEGESHLDRYADERNVFYGVVSADLTGSTRLNLGYSINEDSIDGTSSGALPLFYSNGQVSDYDVSTSTAPYWAYRDTTQTRAFVELEQDLNENWMVKAIYTQNDKEQEVENFYLSEALSYPDPVTQEGLVGIASQYAADDQEKIADLFISGTFELFGQQHELVTGFNTADIKLTAHSVYASRWQGYDDPVGGNWASGLTPRPTYDVFDPANQTTNIDQQQDSFYFSTRLKATDRIAVLLGARTVEIEQDGLSYGAPQKMSETETVPYIGATWEVITGTVLYASYSEVFNPQTWVDASLQPLGPVQGESTEVGVKQELNDGLSVLTFALFESRQENFGEWVTRDQNTGLNIYRGVELESEGFEIELSGEVLPGMNLSMGYTDLSMEDENGEDTRTFIPTRQFKVAGAYQIPSLSKLRVGGGVTWQNEIYFGTEEVQGSYALVDLFAQYDVTHNLTLALNLNNVTDEKYRESPEWGQANYGAPSNVLGSITWRY
ncbi:TonB-dependent siderophore receptor [Ketobacter sp. MCCC 1A13808]|uniref:TonB-dependent siderophore receptor n=1 Tax=Ketobacter sp. MCCC 1A13808 TaxID=2602738 RepID=UPI0012EC00B8|nr:TonB-dependent siderophore receptor [Ketobacter sp. MCCC 1A13808]MVF13996.1 TonB-dependent siderophore receptor [Ketobacter sp. MCCC 1A13808]